MHIPTQMPVSSAPGTCVPWAHTRCCQGLAAMCCAPAATGSYLAGVKGAACLISPLLWQMGTDTTTRLRTMPCPD